MKNAGQKKFKAFQGPGMKSRDFQGLENVLSKFKAFQGFSRCVRTLHIIHVSTGGKPVPFSTPQLVE